MATSLIWMRESSGPSIAGGWMSTNARIIRLAPPLTASAATPNRLSPEGLPN
jgi:hypothetical protein